jgi:serine/threonine-protein kinase RsbT
VPHETGPSSIADQDLIVPIRSDADVINARQGSRELAAALGFGTTDQALIATAVSELARNILSYAGRGEIRLQRQFAAGRSGIAIVASDDGPGIPDVEAAMADGFTTSGGLGLGLPGAKRLMGELVVETGAGGTRITAAKYLEGNG